MAADSTASSRVHEQRPDRLQRLHFVRGLLVFVRRVRQLRQGDPGANHLW
jgi:hypothetical protein